MMIRSFIAVKITSEIQKQIALHLQPLQKDLPASIIRWVKAENIHLTLKFLGDVETEELQALALRLGNQVSTIRAFSLAISDLGVFPGFQRPKVLWLGIQAPPELNELARQVDTSLGVLASRLDTRPFSPHLTIGRVRQEVNRDEVNKIQQAVEMRKKISINTVPVDALHVFKSDLQPSGPLYTDLYSISLRIN